MLNIRLNYKTQRWKFDDAVDEFSLKAFCREENIVLFNEVKLYELPVSQKIRTICSKNWTYKFFIGTNYLRGGLPIESGR